MTVFQHLRAAGVRPGSERVAWLCLQSLRLLAKDAKEPSE